MKIAIPLFNDRVSPHFGVSSTFLFLETNGTAIRREVTWDVPGESPMEIARHLADLGVERLVCGGIQNHHKEWLIRQGIAVVDNQRGVARETAIQLLKGEARKTGAKQALSLKERQAE